jgi:hypothetical protein
MVFPSIKSASLVQFTVDASVDPPFQYDGVEVLIMFVVVCVERVNL